MKPNLKLVTDEPIRKPKPVKTLKRESAREIAARIRKGKPPSRPMFVSEAKRPANGREVWL